MKTQSSPEELLNAITNDLRICLSYTPNRENDLMCFMEQYLKGDSIQRPIILAQIRACMDGKEYSNPFLAYEHYGEEDICNLEQLLMVFVEDMKISSKKEFVLSKLICSLNSLQEKCHGQLIDNWRKEHIVEFISITAKSVGYTTALSLIERNISW